MSLQLSVLVIELFNFGALSSLKEEIFSIHEEQDEEKRRRKIREEVFYDKIISCRTE